MIVRGGMLKKLPPLNAEKKEFNYDFLNDRLLLNYGLELTLQRTNINKTGSRIKEEKSAYKLLFMKFIIY